MASRNTPRAPRGASVARAAAHEQARKAASKAALRAAREAAAPAPVEAPAAPVVHEPRPVDLPAVVAALRIDFEAIGSTDAAVAEAGFDAFLAANGFAPDGTVLVVEAPAKQRVVTESHSMYPLVVKRRNYAVAPNGQKMCGDAHAMVLGIYEPKDVIRILCKALAIENPYLHLNVGQQSMNLRNKARRVLVPSQIVAVAKDLGYQTVEA